MLILLILEQIEEFHKDPDNPIHIFQDSISKFKMTWIDYCEGKNIEKIKINKIIEFLKMLGKPLGFDAINKNMIFLVFFFKF